MTEKLDCIMLVDDSEHDNFFHEREIKKLELTIQIVIKNSGEKALEYLKKDVDAGMHPNLIFLDINMPGMNGWHFLDEYNELDRTLQSKVIIIMLTTSDNPDDIKKGKSYGFVSEYIAKPLTKEKMNTIIGKYFKSLSTAGPS